MPYQVKESMATLVNAIDVDASVLEVAEFITYARDEAKLDGWTDKELEDGLKKLEWEIRFDQNHAHATNNREAYDAIKVSVQMKRDQLRRLLDERSSRIFRGNYYSFHEERR